MRRAHVGTSGFAYAAWKPRFYPQEVAQSKLLQHYASRLSSVEINYTFQRFPTEALLDGWAAKVPEAFTFSLKMPRRITHEKRLRDCAAELERFVEPARTLGARLGIALVQLPPTLHRDDGLLREACSSLPAGMRYAFEFRHASWRCDETKETLSSAGAAIVAAEDDDAAAGEVDASAGFAYLRLRKSAYDDAAVEAWQERIGSLPPEAEVFCYLRHDEDGANAVHAERMLQRLRDGGGR